MENKQDKLSSKIKHKVTKIPKQVLPIAADSAELIGDLAEVAIVVALELLDN